MANYDDLIFGDGPARSSGRKPRARAVEQDDDMAGFLLSRSESTAPAAPAAPPARPAAITAPGTSFGDEQNALMGERDPTPRTQMRGSVFDGQPNEARPRTIEEVGAPLSPEFQRTIVEKYEAATPAQRQALTSRKDWVGSASRAVEQQYEQTPQVVRSALGRRKEDLFGRHLEKGASPEAAEYSANRREDVGDVGSAENTNYDFEQAKFYKDNPAAATIARLADRIPQELGDSVDGYALFAKQALLGQSTDVEKGVFNADKTKDMQRASVVGGNERLGQFKNFEDAVTSIAVQIPSLIVGAATGSEGIALAAMIAQSFGSTYKEGVMADLSPAENTARSAMFAAFEGIGEKFGFGKAFEAANNFFKGVPTKDLSTAFARYFAGQVPGEILTTTGQDLTDKVPAIGLNPELTFKDYLDHVADTIATTLMQGGIGYGATRGALAIRDKVQTDERQVASAINTGIRDTEIDQDAIAQLVQRSMRSDPRSIDPSQTTLPREAPAVNETANKAEGTNDPAGEILTPSTTSTEQQNTSVRTPSNGDEELLKRAAEQERVFDEDGNEVPATAVKSQNEAADPSTAVDTAVPFDDPTVWEPDADLPAPASYNGVEPRGSQQKFIEGLAASPAFQREGLGDVKLAEPNEIGQSRYDSLRQIVRTYKKLFNVDIVLADFGENAKVHGYYDTPSGKIVLNVRSADLTQAITHEAFHAFEKKHQDLFAPIYQSAVQLADPQAMSTMFSTYGLLDKAGVRTDLGKAIDALVADPTDQAARDSLATLLADPQNALARSELLAHVVGQAATPAMYAELVRRSGSAAKANKIIQTLTDFLNGLYQKLFKDVDGREKTVKYIGGPEGIRQIQGMMNDIQSEVQRRTAVARSDARAAKSAPVVAESELQKLDNKENKPAQTTAVNKPTTAVAQCATPAKAAVLASSNEEAVPSLLEAGKPQDGALTAGQAKVESLKQGKKSSGKGKIAKVVIDDDDDDDDEIAAIKADIAKLTKAVNALVKAIS